MPARKRQHGQSCRHLGLTWDASQFLPDPSPDHRCYLWDQEGLVDLSHQHDYCLTSRWRVCPWPSAGSVWNRASAPGRHQALLTGAAASIALVLLVVAASWIAAGRGSATVELTSPETDVARAPEAPGTASAEAEATSVPPSPTIEQPLASSVVSPSPYETRVPGPTPLAGKDVQRLDITTLEDGSAESALVYTGAGTKTIHIKAPLALNVESAQLDVSGEAYAVTEVDQKNEASRHDSTWGVRAQQFRPSGSVMSSVELYLTRSSSKPGDLTVEIRGDDGKGIPSASALASVSKPVAVGGYRWEVFKLPELELEAGGSYWIVTYVKPPGDVAYPATPSVGDYGYYLGMSTRDEYPGGDSADFLTFTTGSRWEKYASRKTWDLMFRTNSIRELFPGELRLYIGDDSAVQWSHPAELKGTAATGNLASELSKYLLSRRGTDGDDVIVPIHIESQTPGVVRISNIRISGSISR